MTAEVVVDFGAAGGPVVRSTVRVPQGASLVEATRQVELVEQRWLCCADDDVWAIGGVGPDPRSDRYWMWRLGEDLGPASPAAYVVREGDRLSWVLSAGDASRVGRLGKLDAVAAFDRSVVAALARIGAEASAAHVRAKGESAEEFAARLLAADWRVVFAAAPVAPRDAATLAAMDVELVELALDEDDEEVRVAAWERLGDEVERLGAARIAARMERPVAASAR